MAMYTFRKHAVTVLPDRDGFVQMLLCLRQYDVPSAGWFFSSGYPTCMGLARAQVRPLTGCLAPDEACDITTCTRQPPSLRDLAFHSYYMLVLNIERFELTQHVTASQYRAAYDSAQVDIQNLLPLEFPSITVLSNSSGCPCRRSHATCYPDNSRVSAATRAFASEEEAVIALYVDKSLYWCSMCDKALFFKIECALLGPFGDMVP